MSDHVSTIRKLPTINSFPSRNTWFPKGLIISGFIPVSLLLYLIIALPSGSGLDITSLRL